MQNPSTTPKTYAIAGTDYPVIQMTNKAPDGTKLKKPVPLVDIPMMSDYRWQQMALEDRIAHPEKYPEEDLTVTVPRLRRWLEEHSEEVNA